MSIYDISYLPKDISWLDIIVHFITLITFAITIWQINTFWSNFNKQNLSADARKGLDCLDDLQQVFNAFMDIVKDKHQGEKQYIPFMNTLNNPLNTLRSALNMLVIRANVDLSESLAWILKLKKILKEDVIQGNKAVIILNEIDQNWRSNDEIDSHEIKSLQEKLINIYQFPDKYLK